MYFLVFILSLFTFLFILAVNENPPRTSTITTEKIQNQGQNYSIQVIKNSLDEFSFLFQDTGLRVDILKGDIIDQIANVIVNPANNALQLSCLFLISLNLYIISLILKLDLERLFYQRLEMKFKKLAIHI
jgi:hypothetical protein